MRRKSIVLMFFILVLLETTSNCTSKAESEISEITFQVKILSINSINNSAEVQFMIKVSPVNSTQQRIWIYITGTGDMYSFQLQRISTNTYRDVSNKTKWDMVGRPYDYPFDTYYTNFTIVSIEYVNMNRVQINQKLSGVSFQGDNTYNQANIWMITEAYTLLPYMNTSKVEMITRFEKNPQWTVPIMLPVWTAFLFLGASFFIRPKELSSRLAILTAIFVFAPVYLLALQGNIPQRFLLSHLELQLLVLITSTGILGFFSIISNTSITYEKQWLGDFCAILISELMIASLIFLRPFYYHVYGSSLSIVVSWIITLSSFAIIGAASIYNARTLYRFPRIN